RESVLRDQVRRQADSDAGLGRRPLRRRHVESRTLHQELSPDERHLHPTPSEVGIFVRGELLGEVCGVKSSVGAHHASSGISVLFPNGWPCLPHGAAWCLGNLWRWLALPRRVETWSLTSLQQRLLETAADW